jgi:hypothetical protein
LPWDTEGSDSEKGIQADLKRIGMASLLPSPAWLEMVMKGCEYFSENLGKKGSEMRFRRLPRGFFVSSKSLKINGFRRLFATGKFISENQTAGLTLCIQSNILEENGPKW